LYQKTIYTRFALFTLAVLAVALLAGISAAQSVPDYLEIRNEYIRIVVNTSPFNSGRFSVGTTGGDPDRATDQNMHLIYGGNEPWTSYTTVRVGNENWIFGSSTNRRAGREGQYGEMISAPEIVDNSIRSVWKLGPVEVTQKLSFARSVTTGLLDTARVEYQLHNTDDVAHLTGLRLVMDTMLGENDGAPYRVEDRALLTDTVYYAQQMPEFWQAFDSLSNPQVMSQGTLKGQEVSTPDRVYFTNWGSLADDLWNFDFTPGRDFTRKGEFELDSAIAMFWDPVPLQPKETRSYVAYYGLGGVTIAAGDLSLGVTSPAQVTADTTHRQSFPIIAYVQNTGRGEAREVTANIRLPRGLQLVEGSARKALGNLQVGDTIQTSWQVIPTGDVSGRINYEVTVNAINSASNQVNRDITIVSPARLQAELRGPLALSVQNERLSPVPVEVTAIVRNIGGTAAHRVNLNLDHPIGLSLAPGERTQKHPGTLEPGEEIRVNWYLEPTGASGNLPYSMRINSSAGQQVINNFVLIPSVTPKVSIAEPTLYSNDRIRPGEHFSVSVWATNVRDFQQAKLDMFFNPDVVEVVGRTLDISQGTLFVDDSTQPPRRLSWTMPSVDNRTGRIIGVAGNRGPENVLPLAFGTLITVHFRAKAPGDTEIRVQNIDISNSEGRLAQFQVVGREIIVHP